MSTLKTGALRGTSGTADSIQLHASNQSVTFPGAVTIAGALTSSTTAVANKILQIQHASWTTEETIQGTFTSECSKSVTPVAGNSDWIFLVQPVRLLVKANSEVKCDIYDSTNSQSVERREWRNYTSSDNRPNGTCIWYEPDWNLTAGSAVTFENRWFTNVTGCTVGDGDRRSDFIIIEVAA